MKIGEKNFRTSSIQREQFLRRFGRFETDEAVWLHCICPPRLFVEGKWNWAFIRRWKRWNGIILLFIFQLYVRTFNILLYFNETGSRLGFRRRWTRHGRNNTSQNACSKTDNLYLVFQRILHSFHFGKIILCRIRKRCV